MRPEQTPQTLASYRLDNSLIGPIRALLARPDDAVLAVIAGVVGPSYRPVGAMMTVFAESDCVGSLSSGCIERDLTLQAMRVRETGQPELVRYGAGSPYVDIRLPCGGGIEVLLLPEPDLEVLADIEQRHRSRCACTLAIDVSTGSMSARATGETGVDGSQLRIRIEPDIQFFIFGKGPEATTFAALVQSAGYSGVLLSPDAETLESAASSGFMVRHIVNAQFPGDLETDERTAVVLFFHDHDWEPPILVSALETSAFYVGAQGSRRARDQRFDALEKLGVPAAKREWLKGPVGLIPSARDPSTLAVSVLAEVLSVAMAD